MSDHGEEYSITISGVPFKIRLKDNLSDEGEIVQGLCDGSQELIELDATMENHRKGRVLLHEVIHAILYITGSTNALKPGQEEDIVTALEYGLWPLMDFRTDTKDELWLD